MCKYFFEKLSNIFGLSFFPERGTEEYSFAKIEELNLSDILLIDNCLIKHFAEGLNDEVDELIANGGIIDVVHERLQQFDGAGVDSGIASIELNAHALKCMALDILN